MACVASSSSNMDAQSASDKAPTTGKSEPHYRLQGEPYAWQPDEPIRAFVARLPPSTTTDHPFLMIDNPRAGGQRRGVGEPALPAGVTYELKRSSRLMLSELWGVLTEPESEIVRRIKDRIGRGGPSGKHIMARRKVMRHLLMDAKRVGYTEGRWAFYVKADVVDRAWRKVARATRDGRLGTSAGVGTLAVAGKNGVPRGVHLICVCTPDFSDISDVGRVLDGVLDIFDELRFEPGAQIFYQADIFKFVGLNHDNKYGIVSSIYGSRRILSLMDCPDHEPFRPGRWTAALELCGRGH